MEDNSCFLGKVNQIPVTSSAQQQKGVIIQQAPGVIVQDVSDSDNYRFIIGGENVTALSASLTLVAKSSGVTKTLPILKGTTIDEVNLAWTYNKPSVSAQTLTNNGGLVAPTLLLSDRSHDYESQSITSNISFTLTGNDGLGFPGSIDTDIRTIEFGNTLYLGHGSSKILTATSGIASFITSMATKVTKTSRIHTYYATGGENQKHFVAYPAAYGMATFTKGPFSGGYVRLKNVLGVLKSTLDPGDTELSISITNSLGYSESYYIYESLVDNQEDPVTPFIIS